jgi:hypothetical protein
VTDKVVERLSAVEAQMETALERHRHDGFIDIRSFANDAHD